MAIINPMTPEEFKIKILKIHDDYEDDWELRHIYMDKLLCETLKGLGYDEGVEIFNETGMWYA